MNILNHLDVVQRAKHELESNGVSLDGPCGAWQLTNLVAWTLRSEGAGLLDKPAGNNCRGYATDIVMYSDGTKVDILGDGGGQNVPAWRELDEEPQPERWRPAVDPDVKPGPVNPPGTAYPGDAVADPIGATLEADYREAGRSLDGGSARWMLRVTWDAVRGDEHGKVLTINESIEKHRREWRTALGLK